MAYDFSDLELLEQAFVHTSYLNETPEFHLASNERLEFLGDAVIGFVVAEYMYARYPELDEGQLTRLRSALVRTRTLAHLAANLAIDELLLLGKGEEATGGRSRQVTLAGAFEALVAAIFLDSGLSEARGFLMRFLDGESERVLRESLHLDYKSSFQEYSQRKYRLTPFYRTITAQGPDHDKRFNVEVVVGDRAIASGEGRSKREAQQAAARAALEVESPFLSN